MSIICHFDRFVGVGGSGMVGRVVLDSMKLSEGDGSGPAAQWRVSGSESPKGQQQHVWAPYSSSVYLAGSSGVQFHWVHKASRLKLAKKSVYLEYI